MKKKLFAIICALLVACLFVVPVSAEEGETPPATEVEGETTTATEGGENPPEGVEETPAEETFSAFFNERILPIIISAATLACGALVLAGPYISKAVKFKQLQGIYTKLNEENESLQHLLNATDVAAFSAALKELLDTIIPPDFTETMEKVKVDQSKVVELRAQIELLAAQIDALVRGAQNAWAQSPGAVAALTAAPTAEAVRKLEAENAALTAYIRDQKQGEADTIIENVKGGAADVEQNEVPTV
jgi:hypothetical protein